MFSIVGLDLLTITIVCALVSSDFTSEPYPHCIQLCYELIESRQSYTPDASHVPQVLRISNHPAVLEQPYLKLLSTLRIVKTKEALFEHFNFVLRCVIANDFLKPSSFFGIYLRSLALAAKHTSLEHWTILHETWQSYGLLIHDQGMSSKLDNDTRSGTNDASCDLVDTTQYSSEHWNHHGPQRASVGMKTSSDTIVLDSYSAWLDMKKSIIYDKSISSWKSGEQTDSVSQLHRHYDYLGSRLDVPCHQYALLDLALLQADFGCHKEALWAICEAIDAARDNLDDSCLEFALTWLRDVEQHRLPLGQAYPNLMTLSPADRESSATRDLNTLQLDNLPSSQTFLVTEKLSAQLQTSSHTKNGSISALLTASQSWSDFDIEQLARLTLRLARVESSTADDTEASIRVRCALSQALFSKGLRAEARTLLDSMDGFVHKNNNLHMIWLTQHAAFNLQEGSYTENELLIELQEIERDPMTIGPRVRRYIEKGHLVEAEDILHKYLRPFTMVMLLQLTSEIYLKSSEPERAFTATVHALKLAHSAHLYKAYRELMQSLDDIAKVLEK